MLEQNANSPAESQLTEGSEQVQNTQQTQDQVTPQTVYELEKLGKFKFDGQDWTPQDLKKAILRERDYTQKTQKHSESVKSFEQERKYYENLAWDLQMVAKDPRLINKFIEVYPSKFHSVLKEYLGGNTQAANEVQKSSQPDVELLSRLDKLEKTYQQMDQEKQDAYIKSVMDRYSKKYPDAIQDLVLAKAIEVHDSGTQLNDESWEKIFKQVDEQCKNHVKARYGELINKQKTANEKSKDVSSGGGTVGQAPKKMSFKEATEAAIQGLSTRQS